MMEHPSIDELLTSIRAIISEESGRLAPAPPSPGAGDGNPLRQGPFTLWAGNPSVRTSGGNFQGRFWGWRVLSDLAIGMEARRKAWPDGWLLQLGPDDTLLLTTHEGVIPWCPTQADLMTADWETGD